MALVVAFRVELGPSPRRRWHSPRLRSALLGLFNSWAPDFPGHDGHFPAQQRSHSRGEATLVRKFRSKAERPLSRTEEFFRILEGAASPTPACLGCQSSQPIARRRNAGGVIPSLGVPASLVQHSRH
jgi:hypothetical protein